MQSTSLTKMVCLLTLISTAGVVRAEETLVPITDAPTGSASVSFPTEFETESPGVPAPSMADWGEHPPEEVFEPHHAEKLHEPIHEPHHAEHHEEHHHAHHHHHEYPHELEEKKGRFVVTPFYREFDSDLWDNTFKGMSGFHLGTTFWKPWHELGGCWFARHGFSTEFTYGSMDAEENVNLNGRVLSRFETSSFNFRVDEAQLYAGTLGLPLEITRYSEASGTRLDFGMSPTINIGNLTADIEPTGRRPNADQYILRAKPSENGTLVNFDMRFWTGIALPNDVRAGVMGFIGYGQTDAVFGRSEQFTSYGGGMYIDIPTRFVPHEFPAPAGTFQWLEVLCGEH